MTKTYKPSELNLRRGELIEIDAGRDGRFVGYISHGTEKSITLQPSMPFRETKTDYDNYFTFYYANFEEPIIVITRLRDTPMGLERTMLLDTKNNN